MGDKKERCCGFCGARNITWICTMRQRGSGLELEACRLCARMFGVLRGDHLCTSPEARRRANERSRRLEPTGLLTAAENAAYDENQRTGLWPAGFLVAGRLM